MSDVNQQGALETTRAPPRHLRSVGRLEWFLFARTKARADSCVIVAARYLPTHSGDVINKAALYPALLEVVRNNVALASRIAPASGRRGPPEWVRLSSLDLDRVVEFVNDDFSDLESIFESQFRRGFDPDTDLPLWRLAVLRDGTLVFAFDHTLCDGLGGLAFHRLLLAALQENRTSPSSVRFTEGQNLPPPLEDATRISVPWRTVFRETLKCLNPLAWRRHLATWAGNRIPVSFELSTCVHILTYSPAEARRLRALAGAHKATLTATLHTLALLVLSRLLDKHAHGKFASTTTYVPVSLRHATGASADDFCNHYSYVFSEHRLFSGPVLRFGDGDDEGAGPESFPWADAARFAERLRGAAPHAASAMGLLKLVGSPGRRGGFVRRALGHRRIIGIELANLGSFSLGLGEEQEEVGGEGGEEELEGRRAVEVVPTPAVAVAETVQSQDADRAARTVSVGDASAAAAAGAETTENENASPSAILPAGRTDTANTDGGDLNERFATPPESMPGSPLSAAHGAQIPIPVDIAPGNRATPTRRETINGAPVAGDKDAEIPPHMSPSLSAVMPSGPPIETEGISREQRARNDGTQALNYNVPPTPESGAIAKATSLSPAPAPKSEPARSVDPPEAIARNGSTRDVDSDVDGRPAHQHQHEHTMPAKAAQTAAAAVVPVDPEAADVRTEECEDTPPPRARGRSISEADTRDRLGVGLSPAVSASAAKPELEPVSPHAPTGCADPPHAAAATPTPAARTHPSARDPQGHRDRNTAPVANSRPARAGSPTSASASPDNAGGPGQARRVGNAFPPQARAQARSIGGGQQPPHPHPHPKPESPLREAEAPALWTLREVLYAQADGTLGAALKVCVAGTPAGGLGVVISWGASAVDGEFGKEFVVGFADGLRELTLDDRDRDHSDLRLDAGMGGEPADDQR